MADMIAYGPIHREHKVYVKDFDEARLKFIEDGFTVHCMMDICDGESIIDMWAMKGCVRVDIYLEPLAAQIKSN